VAALSVAVLAGADAAQAAPAAPASSAGVCYVDTVNGTKYQAGTPVCNTAAVHNASTRSGFFLAATLVFIIVYIVVQSSRRDAATRAGRSLEEMLALPDPLREAVFEAMGQGRKWRFLGFGLRPPTPEWGLMISENRALLIISPSTVLGPGLSLASLVVGLNLFTEGLARVLGRTVKLGTQ
jgi:Na+/H+ antiporter NhaC